MKCYALIDIFESSKLEENLLFVFFGNKMFMSENAYIHFNLVVVFLEFILKQNNFIFV